MSTFFSFEGIDDGRKVGIERALARLGQGGKEEDVWTELVTKVLDPTDDFELHSALYKHVYRSRGLLAIRPTWLPSSESKAKSNICSLMTTLGSTCGGSYDDLYRWSVGPQTRYEYWEKAIEQLGVVFETPPSSIFDTTEGIARASYLPGAKLNIAKSCFHRRPTTDTAIIFANESDPTTLHRWSFAKLDALSNNVANSLRVGLGFEVGDTIGICMPMSAECVAVYIGIIKAGLTVVSIADSFSSIEIETRLRLSKARGIFTQDVIFRGAKFLGLYERVLDAMASLEKEQQKKIQCIVLPGLLVVDGSTATHTSALAKFRTEGLDMTWVDFLAAYGGGGDSSSSSSNPEVFEPVILPATHPANILFSSGTTGEPKAIIWSQATPIKAAVDGAMHQDIKLGEVVCWPTNIGWMMGPWLLFQLINGATLALFNGITSTKDFCRFVEQAEVNMLGVVPSLVKSWRALQGPWDYDWSKVGRFSSTGEASDPTTMHWLMSRVKGYAPVIEYCGGTEIGGSFLSSTVVQPNAPSMFSTAVLGSQLFILDDTGFLVSGVGSGEVVLVPPTLGYSTRLLNRDHFECYYEGMQRGPGGEVLRRHGDEIEAAVVMTLAEEELLRQASEAASPQALAIAARGETDWKYYRALGRCDDTMNLGGIKISSVEIERVCNLVDGIHETAAIAVNPASGGPSLLVVYVVLTPNSNSGGAALDGDVEEEEANSAVTAALKPQLQTSIKTRLNPLFHIHDVVLTKRLPRTASNKIMRRVLRDEYITARSRSGTREGPGLARSATYNASVAKLSSGGSVFKLSSSSASLPGSDSPRAGLSSLASLSGELDSAAAGGGSTPTTSTPRSAPVNF